jgi:hypothetical protein
VSKTSRYLAAKMLATLSFQNGLRLASVMPKLVYFVLRSDPDNTTHPGGWLRDAQSSCGQRVQQRGIDTWALHRVLCVWSVGSDWLDACFRGIVHGSTYFLACGSIVRPGSLSLGIVRRHPCCGEIRRWSSMPQSGATWKLPAYVRGVRKCDGFLSKYVSKRRLKHCIFDG